MNSKRTRKRYNKNTKIIIIMVLTIGVIGLSIGFSAFSKNLDINSTATVTPDPSNFKVLFSTQRDSLQAGDVVGSGNGVSGYVAGNATLTGTQISGINAIFTQPNQRADYTFYARNEGEYDAYLKSINYANVTNYSAPIKCTAKPGTSQALVDEACKYIKVNVHVGDGYKVSNASCDSTNTICTSTTLTDINNHKLIKKTAEQVNVEIWYYVWGAVADGDFTIEVGNITLTYSSSDS